MESIISVTSTQHVVASQYYEETNSDEAYEILCDRFEFPEPLKPELRKQLEDFAAIWRWHHDRSKHVRQPSRDAKALALVARQSQKLQLALDALSDNASIAMQQTSHQYEMQSFDFEKNFSDVGHEFYRYTDQDGTETTLYQDIQDLVRSVSIIKLVAVEAKENIGSMPVGPRFDLSMTMWITNVAIMWTEKLGRPFTRDTTSKGDPLTEAAQFCIDAFHPISPSTPNSKILNEMKKHITKSRKKTTGKV